MKSINLHEFIGRFHTYLFWQLMNDNLARLKRTRESVTQSNAAHFFAFDSFIANTPNCRKKRIEENEFFRNEVCVEGFNPLAFLN